MLSKKQKIIKNTSFIKEKEKIKEMYKNKKNKLKITILSTLFCLIIISIAYLLSSKSNLSNIVVEGNIYLNSDDIIECSQLKKDDKYVFVNANSVKSKILKHELIADCEVIKCDDLSIKISIKEKKPIGYSFDDDNVLILEDNSTIVLNKDNLYLIGKVPLIEGVPKDELILLVKKMSEIDYKIINEISEIHYYPKLKFQRYEFIMRDGNYVFTSVYGLNVLNNYYEMATNFEGDEKKCLYVEDISGNAFLSSCPWEPSKEDDIPQTKEDASEKIDNED